MTHYPKGYFASAAYKASGIGKRPLIREIVRLAHNLLTQRQRAAA